MHVCLNILEYVRKCQAEHSSQSDSSQLITSFSDDSWEVSALSSILWSSARWFSAVHITLQGRRNRSGWSGYGRTNFRCTNVGVFLAILTRARRLAGTFFLALILPYHVPAHMSRTRVDTYVHSTPAHAAPVHHTRRKRRIHADYFFGI